MFIVRDLLTRKIGFAVFQWTRLKSNHKKHKRVKHRVEFPKHTLSEDKYNMIVSTLVMLPWLITILLICLVKMVIQLHYMIHFCIAHAKLTRKVNFDFIFHIALQNITYVSSQGKLEFRIFSLQPRFHWWRAYLYNALSVMGSHPYVYGH